jgi:outer membrane lipoprotein-sorting protein
MSSDATGDLKVKVRRQSYALRRALACAALATLLAAVASWAQQRPNAHALVQKTDRALRGRTQHGKASMTVQTPDWKRTVEMECWSINPDKTFILITAPAKEEGTSTLRLGTNMWNYLPQVERIIKIPPSLMLQSWMGSDFTNDDLVKESSLVNDYTHEITGETTVAGDACWRVVAHPKPNAAVVWGKLVLLIRKSDALPRKEEYYDEKGRLQKSLTFSNFQRAGDRDYPMRWQMVSVNKPGHETTLAYHSLVFDRPIPSRVFTRQNMKRQF